MSNTNDYCSIDGEWTGTVVFECENSLLSASNITLSFTVPDLKSTRFIGEIENSHDGSHALICGNRIGPTLRFSGSFRFDNNDDELYAEFIATVSHDNLAIRGSVRQQFKAPGEPFRLLNGSWHVKRTVIEPDRDLAGAVKIYADAFAQ